MAFFNQAITVLQTLVIALGAGLGIWGVINLLEGYGNDNPGANGYGLHPKVLLPAAGTPQRYRFCLQIQPAQQHFAGHTGKVCFPL